MSKRVLMKEFRIGEWYKNYYQHEFVQMWAWIDEDGKLEKDCFQIVRHTPACDIADCYTLEKAEEVYAYYIEKIKANNAHGLEEVEEVKERYNELVKKEEEKEEVKETKDLFINDEVARIEKTERKTWFLVCDDNIGLREVTYSEFKKFLQNISFVCLTSWNTDLQKRYIEFVQYFSKL